MAATPGKPYDIDYDLSNCDEEPLHLIRHYQAHAMLVVAGLKDNLIYAFSANVPSFTKHNEKDLLNAPLAKILDADTLGEIEQLIKNRDYAARNLIHVPGWRNEVFSDGANLILHETDQLLVLEFEARQAAVSSAEFLLQVDRSLQLVQASGKADELFGIMVDEVKRLSGYDRVMLYQFDEAYNGTVVAEAREKALEAFLGLKYPHTDIPSQARELYLANQIRHIVTTEPEAVSMIVAVPGLKDIDLSLAANRGSSPIHLKYLSNMGVWASMSIAVIVSGKLWGLIACHHNSPRYIDYRLRTLLKFLGNLLSSHLALHQSSKLQRKVIQTGILRSRLFEKMSEEHKIVKPLLQTKPGILELTDSDGCAIVFNDEIHLLGKSPEKAEVKQIVDWLADRRESHFFSHQLANEMPLVTTFEHPPGGMLSIRLSPVPEEYIIWFRQQVSHTIKWAGRPDQRKLLVAQKVQLHPELSFQKWEQRVEGLAIKWEQYQIDAAISLRNDIKEVILAKYQDIRKRNKELVNAYDELQSFSYSVSHDLRSPLRNIKSFAEILQEDYLDKLDDYGQMALSTILKSTDKMSNFIDDMLSFSRVQKGDLATNEIELEALIWEIWEDVKPVGSSVSLEVVADVNFMYGDLVQIRQLFANLLSNAIKYSKNVAAPKVNVNIQLESEQLVIKVQDNGIGLQMKNAGRIFDAFHRLVSDDVFEGSGVGLAIAKRVVERHEGTIEVYGEPGNGAVFTVTFPATSIHKKGD